MSSGACSRFSFFCGNCLYFFTTRTNRCGDFVCFLWWFLGFYHKSCVFVVKIACFTVVVEWRFDGFVTFVFLTCLSSFYVSYVIAYIIAVSMVYGYLPHVYATGGRNCVARCIPSPPLMPFAPTTQQQTRFSPFMWWVYGCDLHTQSYTMR